LVFAFTYLYAKNVPIVSTEGDGGLKIDKNIYLLIFLSVLRENEAIY